MAVLKCKMCGGDLVFEPDSTVCECEYCGSKQTIPVVDDEKKMKLYERANKLRYNCDFDKAAGVYENIIADFPDEAEAYWGLLLCKFGIEYVDSPDGRKVPTCHRSSFDSIMDDPDFEMVMENSDDDSRGVYRAQAKQIEEIRKGIIEVSGKEPPYDIFICYKETAKDGQRTLDSVLAQDIYDELTAKGYRVFFSRVTLEDKLGTEYEPYIFAALNSAKLMIAFGTSYDYYNAVWVKNEWSRYLKLMAQDKSKHLIPCYKDIDAYDMPKEFAKLQAQDLGKMGATQDLLRGIEKILGGKKEQPAAQSAQTVIVQQTGSGPNVAALLQRGDNALEDSEWDAASGFFDQVLNMDASNAEAYLGLFMAELHCSSRWDAMAKFVDGDYTENKHWKRAKQYAEGEFSEELNDWDEKRDARLQREADAARKAQEEAEQEALAAEEDERKKLEEAKVLLEQLRTGKFELTAEEAAAREHLAAAAKSAEAAFQIAKKAYEESSEMQELAHLETEISSKKTQLAGLGIFKGKEKKALQAQIDMLEGTLAEVQKKVAQKQVELDYVKNQAVAAKKQSEEYINRTISSKKKVVREHLLSILELDISGEIVKFGSYVQKDSVEQIEWRVLDRTDKGMLLISKYVLDAKAYNKRCSDDYVPWERCSLRKWLNTDFLHMAFTKAQQSFIAETMCPADKNPEYATPPENATRDKVFLLSIPEAEKYFLEWEGRKTLPTVYAKKQGAKTYKYRIEDGTAACEYRMANGTATCAWWLRSPGRGICAAYVWYSGSISCFGLARSVENGVRPALWLDMKDLLTDV